MKSKLVFTIFFVLSLGFFSFVQAVDYQSASFINRDPVINMAGGKSTSASFQLLTDSGEMVIGESTSTNFIGRAGFLYFPSVTTPIISATAGDAQVSLGWTSAVGTLGFTITAYEIGQSTVSGGPYSYTNVGNILSTVRSGLTNGTTYRFVIRALDFYGNPVATSTEVSAAPASAVVPPPSDGGGGGGGGGAAPVAVQTMAIFSGRAYPGSTITLLKDAQVAATTVAGQDAKFSITLTNLTAGNFIFSVYSEDNKGLRSSLLSFPVGVTAGATTNVSGIFIAPTISVDKSEVKKGDNIAIFGQSTPTADIVITVNSDNEIFVKTKSDSTGVYLYTLDTSPLELGQHLTKSKASVGGEISGYSPVAGFQVSDKNVEKTLQRISNKADLNGDNKVDLIDFSILAYWYKRPLTATVKASVDLNGDGRVDLIDFSIMAYHWTG